MTHTLDLPENVERVLEAKARRRGVPLETLLLDLAAQDAASEESAEAARREAVKRGRGKFAHCGETPEERRRAKDEEMRRDTGKFNAHFGANASTSGSVA
jgi:hypothetical protein